MALDAGTVQVTFGAVLDRTFAATLRQIEQIERQTRTVNIAVSGGGMNAAMQAERELTRLQQQQSRERTAAATIEGRERVATANNAARQVVAAERVAAQQATAAMRTGSQERIAEANRESRERVAAINNAARAERQQASLAARGSSSGGGGGIGVAGVAVGSFLGNVAAQGAAAVAQSVVQATTAIVGFSAATERAQTAFTSFLGSTSAAADMVARLKEFSNATSFDFASAQTGAQRLLNVGVAANQVIPLLNDVGNAVARAGGGAAQIDQVTRALSQIQSKGKVSAEEMNQLAEAGINGFGILAQVMGKTESEVRAMAEAGKISGAEFLAAFHEWGQLPDVAGQMQAQARTFTGAVGIIQDSLLSAGSEMFAPLFNGVRDLAVNIANFVRTPWFAEFVQHVQAAVQAAMNVLGKFVAFLAPLGDLLGKTLGIDVGRIQREMDAVAKTRPDFSGGKNAFGAVTSGTSAAADETARYKAELSSLNATLLDEHKALDKVNLALQANRDAQQAVRDRYEPRIRANARAIQDAQRLSPAENTRNTRLAEIGIAKMRIEVEKPDTSVYEGIVKEADRYLRQLSDKKYVIDLGFASEGKALEAEAHRLSKLNTDVEEGRVKDVQTQIRSLSAAAEAANRGFDKEAAPIKERVDEASRALSERTRLLDVGAKGVRDEMEAAQKLTDAQTRSLDNQAKTIRTRMDEAARATAEQTRLLNVQGKVIRERMDEAARATDAATRALDGQTKVVSAHAEAAKQAAERTVRGLDAGAKIVQNAISDVSEGARVETTAIERWVSGQREAMRGIGDEADAQMAVLSKQGDALKTQMDAIGRGRTVDRRIEDLQRQLAAPELDTTGHRNQLTALSSQRAAGGDGGAIDAAYLATSRQMREAVRGDRAKRVAAKSELEQLQERQVIQKRMDEDHRADLQGQLAIIEGQTKAIRESADTRKTEIEAGIRAAEVEKQGIADTLTIQKDYLQAQADGIAGRKTLVEDEARVVAEGFANRLAAIAGEKDTLVENARIVREADEGRLRALDGQRDRLNETARIARETDEGWLRAIDTEKDRVTENARIAREGFDTRLKAIDTEKAGVIEAARIARESDEGRLRDIEKRRGLIADAAYDEGKRLDANLTLAQAALDARTKEIQGERDANAEAVYQLGLRKGASDEYFAAEERTTNLRKRGAEDSIKAINDEVTRQTDLLDKEAAGLNLAKAQDDLRRAATLAPLQAEQERLNRAMEDALLPLQKRQAELEKEARLIQANITLHEREKQEIQAKLDLLKQPPVNGFGAGLAETGNLGRSPAKEGFIGPPAPVENGWTRFFDEIQKIAGGVAKVAGSIVDKIGEETPKLVKKLADWGIAFVEFMKPHLGPLAEKVGAAAVKIMDGILDKAPDIAKALVEWGDQFIAWVEPRLPEIGAQAQRIAQRVMTDFFGEVDKQLKETAAKRDKSGDWGRALYGENPDGTKANLDQQLRSTANIIGQWLDEVDKKYQDLGKKVRDQTGLTTATSEQMWGTWGVAVGNYFSKVGSDAQRDFGADGTVAREFEIFGKDVQRLFGEGRVLGTTFSNFGRDVRKVFGGDGEEGVIGASFRNLGTAAEAAKNTVGKAFSDLGTVARGVFGGDGEEGIIGKAFRLAGTAAESAKNTVGSWLVGTDGKGGILSFFQSVGDKAGQIFGEGGSIGQAFSSLGTTVRTALDGPLGLIEAFVNTIIGAIRKLGDLFGNNDMKSMADVKFTLPAAAATAPAALNTPGPGMRSGAGAGSGHGGGVGGGGNPFDALGAAAGGLRDRAVSAVGGVFGGITPPQLPGVLSGLGAGILDKVKTAAIDWVMGKLPGQSGSSSGASGATGAAGMDGLRPLITQYADKFGIPRDLAAALVDRESAGGTYRYSKYDTDAAGNPYAFGLPQIDRRYHSAFLNSAAPNGGTMRDFIQTPAGDGAALDYGFRLLKEKYDLNGRDWDTALLRYNGGADYPGIIRGLQPRYAGWMQDAAAAVAAGAGGYAKPVSGYSVTQEYGPVSAEIQRQFGYSFHDGIDLAARRGTPVGAIAPGQVTHAGWAEGGYGNLVKIDHGGGLVSWYEHLNDVVARLGQTVAAGERIGSVGTTGNSNGDHLHLKATRNGQASNPRELIPGLANGGYFPAHTPTLAVIGEGQHEEVASPVPVLKTAMRDVLRGEGGNGTTTVTVAPGAIVVHAAPGMDERAVARLIAEEMEDLFVNAPRSRGQ